MLTELLGDEVAIALFAGAFSIASAGIAYAAAISSIRREFHLEMRAESLVRRLLRHRRYRYRTFKTIKYHVGGFEDDELRKILVRAGAIRFYDGQNKEIWGLLERARWDVFREAGTGQN